MIKTDSATIWQEFEDNKTWLTSNGFQKMWKECTDFKEGRHWKQPTAKTKCMPRFVINQCGFIIKNKKSNILSQSLKMVFSPGELPSDGSDSTDLIKAAEDYTDAAAGTWEDVDQDALNEAAVDSALTKGTGIFHYSFNNSYHGGQFTEFQGRLEGEIIRPIDVCLGNPQLRPYETQKQPFIIVRRSTDADELKERAKKNGEGWEKIRPDEQYRTDKSDRETTKNSNTATSLVKYYKQKGEIYWVEVTETAVVQKPIRLAPSTSEKPFTLYPIEILVFEELDECSFGRSAIQDAVSVNKAINWLYGMIMLGVQGNAWPRILAKVGALLQSVTNEPGEILTDNYTGPSDGIKYLQPPNFSQMPIELADKLQEMSRQTTSTTEVISGEVLGANMAASAIIALQNQAKKPSESDQNKFFRSIKNIGQIEQEFYKCYYNLPRPIKGTDQQGNEITKAFTGSDSANVNFGLKIDVGPASVFSESIQVSVLEKMFDKGALDKYQYIKYLPKNVVSQELSHDFEKEQQEIQEQQAIQQQAIKQAKANLTPQEQQELAANPQIMQQVMQGMGGGQVG
jgi:hypothetical protein